MLSEIQIRRACPEDAPVVVRVLYESFVEYRPLYTPGGFTATTPGVEQILARMSEGPVWVACRGVEVVGTVAARLKEQSLYVRGMGVLPAARGSRVAAALLSQVESWAVEQGCARVFLDTTPFLGAAIRLYETAGFRRIPGSLHDLLVRRCLPWKSAFGRKQGMADRLGQP